MRAIVNGACCNVLCIILLMQTAQAQQNNAIPGQLPSEVSRHGGPIFSTACDPFMTHRQERRIVDALRTENDADWTQLSLRDFQREQGAKIRIYVDHDELQMIGIDPDATWRYGDIPPAPLGMRLATLLKPQGLTYVIAGNQLTITSLDAVDSDPPVRVYDVTPLVLYSYRGGRLYKFDELARLVQQSIAPDCWLVAGGTSSISSYTTGPTGGATGPTGGKRALLVIACPTPTQLAIQCLLDRLNGWLGAENDMAFKDSSVFLDWHP